VTQKEAYVVLTFLFPHFFPFAFPFFPPPGIRYNAFDFPWLEKMTTSEADEAHSAGLAAPFLQDARHDMKNFLFLSLPPLSGLLLISPLLSRCDFDHVLNSFSFPETCGDREYPLPVPALGKAVQTRTWRITLSTAPLSCSSFYFLPYFCVRQASVFKNGWDRQRSALVVILVRESFFS